MAGLDRNMLNLIKYLAKNQIRMPRQQPLHVWPMIKPKRMKSKLGITQN